MTLILFYRISVLDDRTSMTLIDMTSTNSQEDDDVTYCKSSEKHGNKRLVRCNSIGLSGEKKRKFLKEFLENLPEIMRDEVLAEMMRDEEEKMLKDLKERWEET